MTRFLIGWLVLALGATAPLAAQTEPSPASFFAAHRAAFMERMAGGMALLMAQPEIARNDDAGYFFRQDSDFYYLTGFTEPETVAVLHPSAPEGEQYLLFVRPRDPAQEIWTGHRAGLEGARRDYGADQAFVIDSLDVVLERLLARADRVYFDASTDHPWAQEAMRQKLEPWKAADPARELLEASAILHEMRLIKSPAEVELLQRAIDLTTDAHRAAMAAIQPGMCECEVAALIEYVYRKAGSPRVGFNSIVGSGPNSTTLHYEANQRTMDGDDMLVMDIGAEWGYYTADVTRTVPVDGDFSPEQAAIYQIVLDAQQAGIDMTAPGVRMRDIHRRAVEIVTEGLIRVGLLEGTVAANIESTAYRRFFMHGTSHWLGLDVHDVGSYTEPGSEPAASRILQPGMVFTIEPGIYIAEGSPGVDRKWWNIGVRIEDDVLVTGEGHRLMSNGAPRTIAAIEAMMVGRGVPEVVPPE
ncbi:MAG: aminopeptidase P N-terminal domain-containing protein [Gemmatimonadota bacterium]